MARRLTYEEVSNFIESKGCKLISKEYKNNSTKLEIECNCGEIYKVDYNTFKKGQIRCKKCFWIENEHHNKHTYEYIKEYIENNSNSKLLSNIYKNGSQKLSIKCGECGNSFKKSFYDIRKSQIYICQKCSKDKVNSSFRFTIDDMNEHLESIKSHLRVVSIDDNYKNHYDNVIVKHLKCGKTFESSYKNISSNNKKCPICEANLSSGTIAIIDILNDMGVEYKTEFMFDGCKNIKRLPFDFYLPKYNMCIEFDGKQHFEPIEYFGGEEEFQSRVKNDSIKNKFCQDKNIKLLRIKYNQVNQIEELIKKSIPR